MKKIVVAVAGIITLAVITIGLSFIFHTNDAYKIKSAGYTYDADGKVVEFTKEATYNSAWLSKQKVIMDQSKKKPIDLARVLFLENEVLRFLGKSVVVKSESELIELPKYVNLKEENETQKVTDERDEVIAQLPKGTVVKLAEGRYIIFDDAQLKNNDGLTKQLAPQTIVSIDSNKKIRLMSEQESEELAGDDLYITMDNNPYQFYLQEELFVSTDESKQNIDVRSIKIDMDDQAEGRALKEEAAKKEAESTNHSEQDKQQEKDSSHSAKQAEENEASSNNESNAGTQNGGTGSGNGISSNAPKDETDEADSRNPANQEDMDQVNDIIAKINEVDHQNQFRIPIVDVTLAVKGKVATGDVKIIDASTRLKKLEVVLINRTTNTTIETKVLNATAEQDTFKFDQLEYGNTYQVVIQGSYLSAKDQEQETTFYRQTFKATPVQFDKKVIETGADYLVLEIVPVELFGTIEKFELTYQKNHSEETEKGTKAVDVAALMQGNPVQVRIDGLASNTEYLIEMNDLIVDGKNVTDSKWYLLATTAKKIPTIQGLELAYKDGIGEFSVTPIDLLDQDDTITSVTYKAYLQSDYELNGEAAQVWASTVVGSNQKNTVVKVSRTADMQEGAYLFVAYLTGNQGEGDFMIQSPPSNAVTIGMKTKPEVSFELNQADQDALHLNYEIYDESGVLRYDEFTHPEMRIYQSDAAGTVHEDQQPIDIIHLYRQAELPEKLSFTELEEETWYVVQLYASYDLDNGTGVQKNVRITDRNYQAFKTDKVKTVEANFVQNIEETDLESVTFNLNFTTKENAAKIKSATMQILNEKGHMIQTISLEDDLISLIEATGKDYQIQQLAINQAYTIQIVDAVDSGGNEVPITGELNFKTKRRAPEADAVLLNYVSTNSVADLEGLAGDRVTNTPMTDIDDAIKSIRYDIFKKNAEDYSIMVQEVTETSAFPKWVKFNLLSPDLGRGYTYQIKALVTWDDNYNEHTIQLESDYQDIKKQGPEIQYQFISRDETQLRLKVMVSDPENTAVAGTLKLTTTDFEVNLVNGTNDISIPTTNATDLLIEAKGDYRLIENEVPISETFMQKKVKGLLQQNPGMTGAIDLDLVRRQISVATTGGANQAELVAIQHTLLDTATQTAISEWHTNGATLFGNTGIPIPVDGKIWFNHQYNLALNVTMKHLENKIDYEHFNGQYYLNTETGYVISGATGKIGISAQQNQAVVFELTNGSVSSNGDITGIKLKNALTGKYFAMRSGLLVDNGNQPTIVDLKRQLNGSYLVKIGTGYADFTTATVTTSESLATQIDIYSIASTEQLGFLQSSVDIPELKAPVIKIDKIEVFDARVAIDLVGKDDDETLIKVVNQKQLFANVYKASDSEPRTPIVSMPISNISEKKLNLVDLAPDVDYILKIEGQHDVLDGTGVVAAVYDEATFQTEKSLPVIHSAVYKWDVKARLVNGTVDFLDVSQVLSDMTYVFYEKDEDTSKIDFKNPNLVEAEAILAAKPKVTSYQYLNPSPLNPSDKTPKFNMYGPDGKQLYVALPAGKEYIIAAYMNANIKGTQKVFLGNVATVKMVSPRNPNIKLKFKEKDKKWVEYEFSYNDLDGYLVGGDNKQFTYKIIETATNKVAYQGNFVGGRTASWTYKDLQEVLKPGTGYKFVVEYQFDDLNGVGVRTGSIEDNFTTDDQYLDYARLILDSANQEVVMSLRDLTENNAKIKGIQVVLYEVINRGTKDEKYEAIGTPQTISVPSSYPANLTNIKFNVAGYKNKYVIGKMFITYDTKSEKGRVDELVSNEQYLITKSSRSATVLFSTVEPTIDTLNVVIDGANLDQNATYHMALTDDQDQIMDQKEVTGKELNQEMTLSMNPVPSYTLTISDELDQVVGQYTGNNEMNLVKAHIQEKRVQLSSFSSEANDEELLVKVSPKKLTLWQNVQTWFGKEFSEEYSITKGQLRAGFEITKQHEDDVLEIHEKKSGKPVGIIEMEMSQ
ncbi:hypothetical protein [Isobaculum melis]|uniref:ATP phosphoribosyltransferase regulatory subunit n=1 Tax=Isobaculum melis TaxID=142588 RepID=A0A1H9PSX3_9LACT|nr:hypothetical protein [Isobaculum melis]SER51311.1 hypothetical protein SAMN04488559_101117 [Isobaculum melis]